MAHHTRFIILHNDGHSQSFVGNPQSNRHKAEAELERLVIDDGYARNELTVVEVPN